VGKAQSIDEFQNKVGSRETVGKIKCEKARAEAFKVFDVVIDVLAAGEIRQIHFALTFQKEAYSFGFNPQVCPCLLEHA
jgi:hypothetical protein